MKRINIEPKTFLYPLPVVMVSCGTMKKPNIITIAYIGTVCSNPPTITFGIRKSRHSYDLIKESKEFVINIPNKELLPATDLNGIISGKDYNKFKASGLSVMKSSKVSAPSIAETPVNLECKLVKEVSLGTHEVFFGEIVNVSIREKYYMDNEFDSKGSKPVCYMRGEYWSLEEKLGTFGYSKMLYKDKL